MFSHSLTSPCHPRPPVPPDTPTESLPAALARATIGAYLEQRRQPTQKSPQLAALLAEAQRDDSPWQRQWLDLHTRKAGAFVSLHSAGDLRGCIGTIAATTASVLDEIIQNAVSAAAKDPRFSPLTQQEYPLLEYSVDVLGAAEPVEGLAQLDAQRYGVIVSDGRRRGLLLPALEGVDTPEQQVAIALRKAGIGARDPYCLERFEVVRYT